MNSDEAKVLKKLNVKQLTNFPELLSAGQNLNKHYLVMERLGNTLQFYQMINRNKFSFKTVNIIGIKLVTLLEQFHSVGYIYNDLKPENICVGVHDNESSLHHLKLIDFGLATPYLESDGNHIEPGKSEFKGNLAFSSKNTFMGMTLSRRDDLYSLMYLLIYLSCGKLPFIIKNSSIID